jgi:hypothetical protein
MPLATGHPIKCNLLRIIAIPSIYRSGRGTIGICYGSFLADILDAWEDINSA